jgi:hypothetical protein
MPDRTDGKSGEDALSPGDLRRHPPHVDEVGHPLQHPGQRPRGRPDIPLSEQRDGHSEPDDRAVLRTAPGAAPRTGGR